MPWVKSNLVCIALGIALQTQTAQAQGDLLGADEMAEAIVSMTSLVWTGPRTPAPNRVLRPGEASLEVRSPHALLAVHADPSVSLRTMRLAVTALERARARLDAMGWPAPISDGDLGGGPEVDLYMTAALPPDAYSDGMTPWTYLDRASTFAVLNPATPTTLLGACVTAAYAEALLMSMDPAEARTWRRATAAWLTWELTGQFGCDEAVTRQQAEPYRSWVGGRRRGRRGRCALARVSLGPARHRTGAFRPGRLGPRQPTHMGGNRAPRGPGSMVGDRDGSRTEWRPTARQHRGAGGPAMVRRARGPEQRRRCRDR